MEVTAMGACSTPQQAKVNKATVAAHMFWFLFSLQIDC